MKKLNILLASLSILGLHGCSNVEEIEKPVTDSNGPSVGQIIQESLNLDDKTKKEETPELSPKEEVKPTPLEPSITSPIIVTPPSQSEDLASIEYEYSIKVLKACDSLIHTITKNVPKKDKPFTMKSRYEKINNTGSKVTVGFESLDAQQIRNAYLGTCEFDLEGNLLSFSADPVKLNVK